MLTAAVVGGLFFPQREALGLDSRQLTPALVQRMIYAVAECRSLQRAAIVLQQVGGNCVSVKTLHRVEGEVGRELAALRDASVAADLPRVFSTVEAPPVLSVAQCDGGRIRTREAGHGRGVHGEAWRETKNACLWRMTHQTFATDPHPELPSAFRNPRKVAKLAEKEPLETAAPPPADEAANLEEPDDWRPQRLVRTCLSSMADSATFGVQMEREAQQRRFYEAPQRAFLGDGLPWNWSLQTEHFPTFVPILDFVHVLSYVYRAALVLTDDADRTWENYLGLARACWQGRVEEVVGALCAWLTRQGVEQPELLEDDHRWAAVATAIRYLTNNRERMDYPRYRRAGLPVTSALMESMVKEINFRVKGTEMFWNDPEGAEAILQIRAAALCDDDRLAKYLAIRPGCPFVRRPPLATAA